MALQCGIVGLPNVGKSTLFNCLSNAKAQAANFPFCTIEPNVGVITVPDRRLVRLTEIDKPRRVVPTTIEIVDIAGLVKGASQGEGLGNKFLANIRNTHAIIHVLRCFENDNITHVDGTIDPVRDKGIIDTELQLKDLETIENRLGKTQKQAAVGGDKAARRQVELLQQGGKIVGVPRWAKHAAQAGTNLCGGQRFIKIGILKHNANFRAHGGIIRGGTQQFHGAGIRAVYAGQQLKQGGFAGAVFANQANNAPGGDFQIQRAKGKTLSLIHI